MPLNEPCLVWGGATDKDGYGIVKRQGKRLRVHRLAWENENGPIPAGLLVLHRCDEPSCYCPSHLFLGTQKDNIRDRDRKGRRGDARGHPKKLSAQDVLRMRQMAAQGYVPQKVLAGQFGIHPSNVSRILGGKRWPEGGYNLCRP